MDVLTNLLVINILQCICISKPSGLYILNMYNFICQVYLVNPGKINFKMHVLSFKHVGICSGVFFFIADNNNLCFIFFSLDLSCNGFIYCINFINETMFSSDEFYRKYIFFLFNFNFYVYYFFPSIFLEINF